MKILTDQPGSTPPAYAIQHNLSMESLLFCDEVGALACPSVALVRQDGPLLNFGEISLLTRFEPVVSDRAFHLYNGDAFLKRVGIAYGVIRGCALNETTARMRDYLAARGLSDIYDIDESLLGRRDRLANARYRVGSMLKNSVAFGLEFLARHGIDAVTYKAPDPLMQSVQALIENHSLLSSLGKPVDPLAEGDLLSQCEALVRDHLSGGQNNECDDDDLISTVARDYLKSAAKLREAGGFDQQATATAISNHLQDPVLRKRYEFEVFTLSREAVPQEWLLRSNSFTKLNLETLTRFLKGSSAGSEEVSSISVGSLVSATLRRIDSPASLNAQIKSILSESEFEAYETRLDARVHAFRVALGGCSNYGNFPEEIRFSPLSLLQRYAAVGKPPEDPETFAKDLQAAGLVLTEDEVDTLFPLAQEALQDVLCGKRAYFEGKFQRAVRLKEFSVAVVPDNLPREVIGILQKEIPDVLFYPARNHSVRREVISRAVVELSSIRLSNEETPSSKGKGISPSSVGFG